MTKSAQPVETGVAAGIAGKTARESNGASGGASDASNTAACSSRAAGFGAGSAMSEPGNTRGTVHVKPLRLLPAWQDMAAFGSADEASELRRSRA